MLISLRYFFAITLLFMTTMSYAAANANPSSAELTTLLNGIRTMQANFIQTSYDNHGKAVQTSYGRMALQRPGQFRWEVTRPIPQLIIANASRLWIYDKDLEQVTIRSLTHAAGETPALLLSHDNTVLEHDFTVNALPQNALPKSAQGQRWFTLIPKKPDSMFAEVQMGFANHQLIEMRLKDHLGHLTGIQFKNAKVNINLPASLFTFKAPAHVDVIDETHKR